MKWQSETYEQKIERLEKPHKWFAWYPVQFNDGTRVWLEYVTRQLSYVHMGVFLSYYSEFKPHCTSEGG